MNIAHLLNNTAQRYGTRPAVALHDRVLLSYRELAQRTRRIAAALRARGLAPGDRVGLAMGNYPEYFEILFGCWQAGLIAVPMNPRLHPSEFAWILGHSGARLCFVGPELAGELAAYQHDCPTLQRLIAIDAPEYHAIAEYPAGLDCAEVDAAAPAWLFYTSGTTGRPKGAMLSHRNLLAMTLAYFADLDRPGPQDAMLHLAPLSHGSGLYMLPHIARGACQVIPESDHFDPEEVWTLLREYPGLSFFAAPVMLRRLCTSHVDEAALRHLRTIVYGGAPMYLADLRSALDVLGPKLAQIYGQGESPMTITALDRSAHADIAHADYEARLASVGYPRSGVEVRVVDELGQPLADGEAGEVVVRGDVVMSGYWQDPVASARALQGGWLHTGDVGSFGGDGYLLLRDRSKDLIISGGSNIYPREVEEVLLRHPGVAEVSVIGCPDAEWGEQVVACLVARDPQLTPGNAELDELCLQHIARYKRPKQYLWLPMLPRNSTGKVLKRELRARFS